jgi:hypothetical protein
MRGAASLSRPQKLLSPTFQVPPSRTAVPAWLLAMVWPPASMLYLTLAWVGEVSVTLVTVEETPCASGLLAKSLIALANLPPFCSSLTRSLAGVDAAKNFAQFALICAVAPVAVPVPAPEADALALVAGGALVVAGAEVELLVVLEQAVAASAIAMLAPATARLLAAWNRIAAPPGVWLSLGTEPDSQLLTALCSLRASSC